MFENNSTQDILISLGIIVAALIINWIITMLNARYLRALAKRTKTPIDNIIVNSLETPLKVGIVLFAIWTAFQRLEMSESFNTTLFKIYEILTVLNVTWFVAHLVNGLLNEYFINKSQRDTYYRHRFTIDSHFISLIKKVVAFLIWTIGVVTALNNVGLDLKAILGTLGIGGIAIALAAQDTVKNIFGGFTILLDGTFRIGDKIKIGDYEGFVEDIGVRSTKIRGYDKQLITMPNYKIVEGAVINISAAVRLRIVMKLGVVYHTTPEKMEQAIDILKNIAMENDAVSKDVILAGFDEFGEYSLNLSFIFFLNDPSVKSKAMTEINTEILKRYNEAGIEFAFPTQTVYKETN